MLRTIAGLALTALLAACASSAQDGTSTAGADLSGAAASTSSSDFDMTETAGGQLDPIGCRHYTKLHLTSSAATLTPALDSADPSDMDSDGSCGGEELPPNGASKYPLAKGEPTDCGAATFTGTIKWTDDGKVTRTLTVTDYRTGHCSSKPARIVAAITSTYQGETNKVATYYSVD
jgi:hypothetical protein